MRRSAAAIVCAVLASAGCSQPTLTAVSPTIDAAQIQTHVARLEAAQADGAEPGGRGEQLAVEYLTSVFRGIGLSVQTQSVQLTKITPKNVSMRVAGRMLRFGDDFVAWTRRHQPVASADGEMVFVGYGISTPRQGWDDYQDVDVRGKILLMLIGDPHTGQQHLLGTLGGDYYGRRKYKLEEAQRRGAVGAFVIRVEDQIGDVPEFSWDVISRTSTEILDVGTPESATAHLPVEGWLTPAAVQGIMKEAGLDFDDLKRSAEQPNFSPVGVPLRVSIEVQNDLSAVASTNVIATLKGVEERDVLYSSQWNALPAGGFTGSDLTDSDPGDQPPPGVAVVLEVARALSREPATSRGTFIFLVVTAESEGLLGLDYYLENPLYPLDQIRAAIHMAGFSDRGVESHISIIGAAFPALKGLMREQAAEQFRVASSDTDSERLRFFRPGEGAYTEKAIPSIFLTSRQPPESVGNVGAPAPRGMSVAVLDAQLLFHVGLRVATANNWPDWKPSRAPVPPGAPAGEEGGRPGGVR
jgi:Peptidase family M28